jgi:TolB-like protein/Tfp pilus assembly protein PilF
MESGGHAYRLLRFHAFEFDPRSGMLRKAGRAVPLQPQPAKILAVLLARAGEVTTREELRREIWHNDTFVDFEHNLNFAVRQIRTALRDNSEKPRFIETLPRRGYRFIAPVREVLHERSGAVSSLAVLPFENLGGDPDKEYLADGITDELISELAKIGALRVISRTSVRRYKGERRPLQEIARRLNVDAIVEGSVFSSGNRVRITTQLIQARNEQHLWTESYVRDLGDVLRLQAEITREIADQIDICLTKREQLRLRTARRIDPAAHDLYLRGRYFWNKRTEDDLKKAELYFQRVIEKEPDYAVAYSGLADTYLYRSYVFGRMDPREGMPKARAAARKALELDYDLGEAHTSLAFLKMAFEWDLRGAAREFAAALRLSPNYATAHHFYSVLLAMTGRLDEAILEAQRALELDPLSVPINNIVGEIYMFADRLDEAAAQYRKALELEPNMGMVHENLGIVLLLKGLDSEAFEEHLQALAFWGESDELLGEFRRAYEGSGWRGFLQKRLQLALERRSGWHFEAFHIAVLYAGLGDAENALSWLEVACEARSGGIIWITLFPFFRNLFSNKRFLQIASRVGLAFPPASGAGKDAVPVNRFNSMAKQEVGSSS